MKTIYCALIALCFNTLNAQQQNITTDNNSKLESMPYYSYGNGIGMTSSDSLFQVNMRFRMQNRVTYIQNEDEDAKYEAQIRRLRLRFDGYVVNPKFLYSIQLGFSHTDIGQIQEGSYSNVVRDAMFIYKHNDHWNFGFGQTKLPGNRQRINSSGALQFTDRSVNNARFNLDRDFGFHVNNLNQFPDKFSYNFKAAISSGEGRGFSSAPDDGVALTGRVELFPLGSFKKNGAFFEGDLLREQTPKFMISATFHQNNKAQHTQGQLGADLFESRDLQAVMLDGIVKYQGWAAMMAYMSRSTDAPITLNPLDATDFNYVFVGSGQDYQLSYNFPSNYEIAGRYSVQNVDSQIHLFTPDRQEYSLGVTRYIWEHAFKLQAEVSLNQLHFYNGAEKQNWYVRFQVEIGI